jgi:hypothetical protein
MPGWPGCDIRAGALGSDALRGAKALCGAVAPGRPKEKASGVGNAGSRSRRGGVVRSGRGRGVTDGDGTTGTGGGRGIAIASGATGGAGSAGAAPTSGDVGA